MELNELIYAGVKLVGEKIGVPRKNTNRNLKPGQDIRLEIQIRDQRQQAKTLREKNAGICWDEKR